MTTILPEREYLEHLRQGRFMIQRAPGTGRHVFYPRIAEPETGAALEWVAASGRGTVYSTSTISQRPPAEAYNVALVDLEEGPRMLSRVEGIAPDAVRIGMAVRAKIIQEGDMPLVVFTPAEALPA
jgi:uncharacterized OB-fold protein